MIVAIVPAAGRSERMGRPKLLLPLGSKRVIEHVVSSLAQSCVSRTILVWPPNLERPDSFERTPRLEVLPLATPTSDMRATILRGLEHVEASGTSPAGFLLVLADQPTIRSTVVDLLVDRFARSDKKILIPTFDGRRGHPVLFDWSLLNSIRSLPIDRGLNQLVAAMRDQVEECQTDETSVVQDMDTPEDYARLIDRFDTDQTDSDVVDR